jgi:tripartite-type tricarboxylate transporter receptor subunit TctC
MMLGIPMQHIPYKGMQPALNDLAGGHIAMMTSPIPRCRSHIVARCVCSA